MALARFTFFNSGESCFIRDSLSICFLSAEIALSSDAPEDIYISPTGCFGIVRRSRERKTTINERLQEVLLNISSEWSAEAIEERSRVQKRGRFSKPVAEKKDGAPLFEEMAEGQLSLFGAIG